ncbi:MAG: amino acid transporter, partial [Thermomicrobiales bacterium]
KEKEQREDNHIPPDDPVLFLEVTIRDASEFAPELLVHGAQVGRYRVLRIESAAIANAIAAVLLYVRDTTGVIPDVYFGWGEGNPIVYLGRFFLFGDGDIAPVTREVLREAEPNPERRPTVHVA